MVFCVLSTAPNVHGLWFVQSNFTDISMRTKTYENFFLAVRRIPSVSFRFNLLRNDLHPRHPPDGFSLALQVVFTRMPRGRQGSKGTVDGM